MNATTPKTKNLAIFFKIFPNAILGVILFFVGSELAIVVRDTATRRPTST